MVGSSTNQLFSRSFCQRLKSFDVVFFSWHRRATSIQKLLPRVASTHPAKLQRQTLRHHTFRRNCVVRYPPLFYCSLYVLSSDVSTSGFGAVQIDSELQHEFYSRQRSELLELARIAVDTGTKQLVAQHKENPNGIDVENAAWRLAYKLLNEAVGALLPDVCEAALKVSAEHVRREIVDNVADAMAAQEQENIQRPAMPPSIDAGNPQVLDLRDLVAALNFVSDQTYTEDSKEAAVKVIESYESRGFVVDINNANM
mmetsp:Transcript_18728/g.47080  ORF Transcript_18728/g.47080 Transcript_18728/m.47080 type:complete len:256 (-) Transcript_18728:414-1181(-)